MLLLLASIILLWSWGYQFSFKHTENNTLSFINVKDSAIAARKISDSLQKSFYNTLDHLDKTIDSVYTNSDSIKGNLEVRLAEFYQLRNQITDSFKNRTTDVDIRLASERINLLQQRVRQLSVSYTDVENENKRLNQLLQQYTNQKKENFTITANTSKAEGFVAYKRKAVKNNFAADFTASDLQLVALALAGEDGKEKETLQAEQPLKLVGSFVIKNNSSEDNSAELMIVVLQPDGRVLQKSTWESGAFQTKAGNKIYSYKMQANCSSGESKRLQFWLSSDKYQKGNYSMQVYHNGIMIAKITKGLS